MKSVFYLLFCFFLFPAFVHAQKKKKGIPESCQPQVPIVVDGVADEWQTEWQSEPKGKYLYNICNDSVNLYIRLKITDELVQRKVGIFGLTVYLNPKGKKIGKMGLTYPVAKDMDELNRNAPKGKLNTAQITELKNQLIREDQVQVLELLGLAKTPITSSRLGLMNGIEVYIKPDSRADWIYEAKIPFKAFRIDKSQVKQLGVAVVSGRLVPKTTNNTSSPAGGGAGNMGYANRFGNMGYGGMGYGGQGYGQPMRSSGPAYNAWNVSTSMLVGVKLK